MIVGVHHVAISVPDMARAKEFYVGALGFEELFGGPWKDKPTTDIVIDLENTSGDMIMLRAGAAFLELWEFTSPVPKPKDPNYPPSHHGISHLCLQVTDIHYEYERLQKAGMTFPGPPVALPEARFAIYGRDPFGNIIELYEVTGPNALPIPSTTDTD